MCGGSLRRQSVKLRAVGRAENGYRFPVRAAPVILALVALAAAGCGGGSKGSSSTSSQTTTRAAAPGGAVSQANFDRRGNAICGAAAKALGTTGPPKTPAQLARYVQKALRAVQTSVRGLSTLRPPAEDKDGLAAFIRLERQQLAQAPALAGAARAHDQKRLQAVIARLTRGATAASQAATSIGLRSCARLALAK